MWIFVAFLAVPLIEIWLFLQVGSLIGTVFTLLLIVLTAIAGAWLVKRQGLKVLSNLNEKLQRLDDPRENLVDGAFLLFSGALLLTPGFFTDTLGFLLFLPKFRQIIISYLRPRIRRHSVGGDTINGVWTSEPMGSGENGARSDWPEITDKH